MFATELTGKILTRTTRSLKILGIGPRRRASSSSIDSSTSCFALVMSGGKGRSGG
jgi:hypothetical protein